MKDELFDKIMNAFYERQYTISQQLDELEKRNKQQWEADNRLINNVEKKFLSQMEEKKQDIEKTSQKFYQQLEDRRIKNEDEPTEVSEFYKEAGWQFKKNKNGEVIDVYKSVDIIVNSRQTGIEEKIKKLETLIQEAGFIITESSGNIIKIEIN